MEQNLHCKYKHLNGFTLVELAIVLVIIGLLIAGILAGRDLIVNAAFNRQIAEWRQLATAYNTYYTKYNKVPGDDNKASNKFSALGNGDGNGALGAYDWGDHYAFIGGGSQWERCLFFDHLAKANLFSFQPNSCGWVTLSPGNNIPKLLGRDDIYYWVTDDYVQFAVPGTPTPDEKLICTGMVVNQSVNQSPHLTTTEAYYFDNKLDDGLPLKGKIKATQEIALVECSQKFDVITSNGCKNSVGEYDLTKTTVQCALSIKMGF